jgi:hypothetical protein
MALEMPSKRYFLPLLQSTENALKKDIYSPSYMALEVPLKGAFRATFALH